MANAAIMAATTVAATAAAAKAREEEEDLTKYSPNDLEGWEFKIVRSNFGRFSNYQHVQQLCQEEAGPVGRWSRSSIVTESGSSGRSTIAAMTTCSSLIRIVRPWAAATARK
jgi:hypothetical protein